MFEFPVTLAVGIRVILVIFALEFHVLFRESNAKYERKNNQNYAEYDR